MIKKIVFSSFLIISVMVGAFGQDTTVVKKKGNSISGKGFRAYTNINLCSWLDKPDSIKSYLFKSRGVDVCIRYSFKFGKSRFGIAPGVGFSSYDLSMNGYLDTLSDSTVIRKVVGSYKKSKFVANYIEVPVELFYESRNKVPTRFAIGFKGSYLLSSHSKFKSSQLKMKTYEVPNIMEYRYGVTLQFTYGWFGVSAFYPLNTMFKSDGPGFTPYTFGITIAPY